MRNVNWSNVEEPKEYKKVAPGGYICKIVKVEDVEDKEYLKIYYDIAQGEFKDYYKDLNESKGFWAGNFIRSYKQTAETFFKGFLTALENSNDNFTVNGFTGDINSLKGKLIGLVLAEEEYPANDGTIKTRLYVSSNRSIESIRKTDFEIPAKKKVDVDQVGFVPVSLSDVDELPF